jgi:hypothetical protein
MAHLQRGVNAVYSCNIYSPRHYAVDRHWGLMSSVSFSLFVFK